MRWENKVHFDCLLSLQHFAKNCRNRTVYVKTTASCKGGTFLLRHSVFVVTTAFMDLIFGLDLLSLLMSFFLVYFEKLSVLAARGTLDFSDYLSSF